MAQNIDIKINVDASQAEQQTVNVRKRMRELMDTMTQLQLQGKEGTAAYASAAKELGKLKDAMGDTAAQARILSDDFFKQRAAMEGLSVGLNIFSGLSQAAALCGIENSELTETLTKLQAAQNLANTAMNIAQALNKDTALMTALRTLNTKELNGELTEEVANEVKVTASTNALNTAEKTATTTGKGLTLTLKGIGTAIKSIPVVGWITAAVTALMVLKGKLDRAREEQKKAYEDTQKQYKEAQDKINKSVADTVVKFDKLRFQYEKLGDTVQEKNKFIKEHQGAFNELGLSIKSVEDAEDAFVKNKTKFIDALMAKAKAAAAFDTATEKFVKIFENKKIIEENNKLAESLRTVWESQGVSQAEIEKSLKTYTVANDELQGEINATIADIESLYEVMGDESTDVPQTIKNTVVEVADEADEFERLNGYVDTTIKYFKEFKEFEEQHKDKPPLEVVNTEELENTIPLIQQVYGEVDEASEEHARKLDKQLQDEYDRIERNRKARIAAFEDAGQIAQEFSDLTSSLMDAELEAVGNNEKAQANIKKKYAKMNFASQVASIGIDTAKGIMSVWSTAGEAGPILGPILGAVQTALIAGIGIAQTVKAKNAMNKALSGKAARGAFVTGRSHSQGGELWELEAGEAVLNKKAMSIPSFRALASAMNESTGGVSFNSSFNGNNSSTVLKADIPEDTVRMIVTDTVSAITAIPVVVTESSITSAQRNVRVLQTRATF